MRKLATKLFEILGKNVMSPQAAKQMSAYPGLRPSVDDGEPGDGRDCVRYLASERDGIRIKVAADGEVLAIFLVSGGKDGFSPFAGELPGGLTFESAPRDVVISLGPPAYRRARGRVGHIEVGELMRFDWPSSSLHIQFRSDNRGIEMITAMTAKSVPGRSVHASTTR